MRALAAVLATALVAIPAFAGAQESAQPEDPLAPCAACHTGKPDAMGPPLAGVVGRTAGSIADFRYSGPLRRSGLVWTPERLRAFLVDPQAAVPGTRMAFAGTTPEQATQMVFELQAGRYPR